MKVFIDPTRCEGTEYCVAISSTVFRIDDEGKAKLAVPQGDPLLDTSRAEMHEAENLCPTNAISVVD